MMKKVVLLVISFLVIVLFCSCSFVTNNYYHNNGSEVNNKSAEDRETTVTNEPAKETQPVKKDNAVSSSVDNTYRQESNANVTEFNYNTPFYGIWVYASKSYDEAASFASEVYSNGFISYTENTKNWINLNNEEWYVVTVGKYSSENEAEKQLSAVKEKYPDAYVKYSGEYKASSSGAYPSFYGIWVYASKSYDEASTFAWDVSSNGFKGFVITTTDWSNLNSEKWYVVTAGEYGSEKEAINMLTEVQKYYPDAYVKYSGDHVDN